MGGDRIFWSIAGRFSGLGDPMKMKLSELRFWMDGHNAMLKEER